MREISDTNQIQQTGRVTYGCGFLEKNRTGVKMVKYWLNILYIEEKALFGEKILQSGRFGVERFLAFTKNSEKTDEIWFVRISEWLKNDKIVLKSTVGQEKEK